MLFRIHSCSYRCFLYLPSVRMRYYGLHLSAYFYSPLVIDFYPDIYTLLTIGLGNTFSKNTCMQFIMFAFL